jgi:hypothetical protein
MVLPMTDPHQDGDKQDRDSMNTSAPFTTRTIPTSQEFLPAERNRRRKMKQRTNAKAQKHERETGNCNETSYGERNAARMRNEAFGLLNSRNGRKRLPRKKQKIRKESRRQGEK